MKVTLDEVREIFNKLIEEKMTREKVSSWALIRQSEDDMNNLEYDPVIEEERIWKAVIYLIGVDLKDVDGSYLHSKQNFIDFKNILKLR